MRTFILAQYKISWFFLPSGKRDEDKMREQSMRLEALAEAAGL